MLSSEELRGLTEHTHKLLGDLSQPYAIPDKRDLEEVHGIWNYWCSPSAWPSLQSVLAQRFWSENHS